MVVAIAGTSRSSVLLKARSNPLGVGKKWSSLSSPNKEDLSGACWPQHPYIASLQKAHGHLQETPSQAFHAPARNTAQGTFIAHAWK